MSDGLPVKVGDSVEFRKTVAECDVYGFAGITGDFGRVHTDAEIMKKSRYGQRIAHGALIVGYMSAAGVRLTQHLDLEKAGYQPVSLGYDKIRFLNAVLIGDTVSVQYSVCEVNEEKSRTLATIEVFNQHGDKVVIGQHLCKWLKQ